MYTDNAYDHEDLFQEVMLQLWKGYPNFKGQSKVTTWMYRVALYTAISFLKKKKKRDEEIQIALEIINDNQDDQQSAIEDLNRGIAKLNDIEKAIMMLYLEDKSYKEMSEILGLTQTNIGAKINRIKKKLKTILSKGYGV